MYQRSLFASVENKKASLRFIMAYNLISFFYGNALENPVRH